MRRGGVAGGEGDAEKIVAAAREAETEEALADKEEEMARRTGNVEEARYWAGADTAAEVWWMEKSWRAGAEVRHWRSGWQQQKKKQRI